MTTPPLDLDAASVKYVEAGADISADGRYRYRLWREWRNYPAPAKWEWWWNDDGTPVVDGAGHQLGEPETVLFIMLNPSTADASADDPTIRKCVGFARRWGYDRMEVVNLFAYRATDPTALLRLRHPDDPIGVRNQEVLEKAAGDCHQIICAWGTYGGHLGQNETVRGWIDPAKRLHALGCSKGGHPRHPLMLAYNTPLVTL